MENGLAGLSKNGSGMTIGVSRGGPTFSLHQPVHGTGILGLCAFLSLLVDLS